MTDAETILKMIEEVDPEDTENLDEIDARTMCFIQGWEFLETHLGQFEYKIPGVMSFMPFYETTPKYTRSRDALKAIRPEGWFFTIMPHLIVGGGFLQVEAEAENSKYDNKLSTLAEELQTEELAELHAIIQAIEYDRSKS